MEASYKALLLQTKAQKWGLFCNMPITQLREQEVSIDSERSQVGMSLRFHTAEQLAILSEPDIENQTDEGAYFARAALLERHYLPTSVMEVLRPYAQDTAAK